MFILRTNWASMGKMRFVNICVFPKLISLNVNEQSLIRKERYKIILEKNLKKETK
jgi:hypothetical protein